MKPNLGHLVPWARDGSVQRTQILYAWCVMRAHRSEVVEWLTWQETLNRVVDDDFEPLNADGDVFFLATTALISDQIAFEFPNGAKPLVDALELSGVGRDDLLSELSRVRLVNRAIEEKLARTEQLPAIVIVGTPARRIDEALLAHLSAWRLDDTGSKVADLLSDGDFGVMKDKREEMYKLGRLWIEHSKVAWMRVWEGRSEVTRARDAESDAASLRGKRVLILGSGALGASIAEHCVRAGVSELTVADKGRVNPGILSRQPYTDADIGRFKAQVLAERLSGIRGDLIVQSLVGDVVTSLLSVTAQEPDVDLVIDATADVGVRNAIERHRMARREHWPNLLSVVIGHDAKNGIGTVATRGVSGGPVDILRRFAIEALASPSLDDIADDFFPREPRTALFFPEPGCSSPTFVGSHADVSALAGMLLNEALAAFATHSDEMSAVVVRRSSRTKPAVDVRTWASDLILPDRSSGAYEIRLSQHALAEMRTEARRGRRLRGQRIETGGMMLGAFDDACLILNVDRAVGPPPDSTLSAKFFDHGIVGTQELVDHRREVTHNRQSFVGLWHSHPHGAAHPSVTDNEGMWRLVNRERIGKRALMVILGGQTWEQWLDEGVEPSIYARLSTLSGQTSEMPMMFGVGSHGADRAFAGGFAYPQGFHSDPGATS
ncbi:ThiF family adenylyltransferase [Microbacterium abyssi]|uniref:ThiF family adenylyltransferase n=1 Tax=Microbacterium abyssi TaxID=2782166 RepID=UPI001E43C907|nr:ThiF family adenylyltransferase [Microbacterium sp. A18JL241]